MRDLILGDTLVRFIVLGLPWILIFFTYIYLLILWRRAENINKLILFQLESCQEIIDNKKERDAKKS